MSQLTFALNLQDPASRRIQVDCTVASGELPLSAGGVEFFLPTWTPGSYLIREYSKHLGDFAATDADSGEGLRHCKTAKNRLWVEVPGSCSRLRISYSVYAHGLSVRTCDLSDQHAFLASAAVFLWPVGLEQATAEIELGLPSHWRVACPLVASPAGPGRFLLHASGLDELADSPILAGELHTLEFEVLDVPHAFVLDGLAGIETPDSLIQDTRKIIERAAELFGGRLPYERYEFLAMFADTGRGGLEHRSCSVLLAPRTTLKPGKSYREFMGLVAHEFFHVWNVKRMRPAELWEFDYERENYSELLWVAEGFTAYYDDHLCRRAGVLSVGQYLEGVAEAIAELRRTPGRLHQSLTEASFDAWIRLYRPDEDTRNTTLSYYGNGALAALCLDLRIREQTGGERSLDDVMRLLFERSFEAGRGYTHRDLVDIASEVADIDLAPLIHSLVRQPLDPDFQSAFAPFGLQLLDKGSADPYLGVHFRKGTTELASVLRGSPADRAGLAPGDEILAMSGLRVTGSRWSSLFDCCASVGEELELLLSRRGRILELGVTPEARPVPDLSLVIVKDSSARQDDLRRAWLFENPGAQ